MKVNLVYKQYYTKIQQFAVVVFSHLVVGGLLSAHLLSGRVGFQLDDNWPCDGPLLNLAFDVAERLLPGLWKKFQAKL